LDCNKSLCILPVRCFIYSLVSLSPPPPPPPPLHTYTHHELMTFLPPQGMCEKREQRLPGLFPDRSTPRAHRFLDKPVFFLSARVHPGESPASHCFNGFLKFIMQEDDPRSVALRRLCVWASFVPLLGPSRPSAPGLSACCESRSLCLSPTLLELS